MLKGFDKNGNIKDVLVTEDGAIKVAMEEGGGGTQQIVVANTSENPVPVNLQNSNIIVGNTAQSPVPVNIQSSNAVPVNVQNPSILVGNTTTNPIPVNVTNTEEIETTLNASIQSIGTTATTIAINKKVTSIEIANYSATAHLTITAGTLQAVVAENIAIALPINKTITNLSIVSDEADTQVQVIVKGVE